MKAKYLDEHKINYARYMTDKTYQKDIIHSAICSAFLKQGFPLEYLESDEFTEQWFYKEGYKNIKIKLDNVASKNLEIEEVK